MKRLSVFVALLALCLAVPASHSFADKPKDPGGGGGGGPDQPYKPPVCVTGKMKNTGRIVLLPNYGVAKRIVVAGAGCWPEKIQPMPGEDCRCARIVK